MGLCFLIRLAVPKYNQPNEALECRGKKNPNSDVGEMEPDVCDTELQVQGRIHAFKFSDVVGGFEWEHGGQCLCVCVGMGECCVRVNRWVNHYQDNAQAVRFFFFFFFFFQRRRSVQREKVLWRVACNYRGSLPRLGWTLTRPPPRKQLQQTATAALKTSLSLSLWLQAVLYQKLPDSWSTRLPEWLIALEERGPAKPRGSSAVLEFWRGRHKDSVEREWQRGSEKWRVGSRTGREMSRIWKQGLLGVPAAYQHPPDCRRWYPPVLGLTSSIPNNTQVPRFDFFKGGERTRVCAHRESCRTSGMQNWCRRLQTPQLYKFACMYESINASVARCLQPRVRAWMSHGSAQLVLWEMKRSLSLPFIWYRRWLEY